MVKEFLSQKGLSFREYDVSVDRNAAQELVTRTGQTGVPVTVINGQTIVGFDQARLEQALGPGSQARRPSFGASIADASKITARQSSVATFGAYIGKVKSGSVAQRLGLQPGDIITEINMQRIANAGDLENVLGRMSKGNRLATIVLRGDKTIGIEGLL